MVPTGEVYTARKDVIQMVLTGEVYTALKDVIQMILTGMSEDDERTFVAH